MSELRRTLGLRALVFQGVGIMLGAGIYTVIGPAAALAGDALWQAFALAGLAAALTAVSYAELAAMHPRAGAEYVYFREARPAARWLPGTAGWALAFAAVAGAAAVARAFAGYAAAFFPGDPGLVAAGLIAAATAVALAGMTWASRVNVLLTVIEAAGVAAAIAAGLGAPGMERVLAAAPHPGIAAAAGLVFFAYLGFEDLANLAEEARDPGRDLPRALFIAIAVTTALYILAAAAASALLAPDDLARSQAPLADAAAVRSPRLGDAIDAIALASTANTALIALVAASRLLFGMARGGSAPRRLAAASGAARTPAAALAVCAAAAMAASLAGGLELLVSVASLLSLLAFAGVNAALVRLRFARAAAQRPFRAPLTAGRWPVTGVLGLAAALALALRFAPEVQALAATALVAGYLLQRSAAARQ
ncbi:MAG: APC family permease [Chloroflexota bacterium]